MTEKQFKLFKRFLKERGLYANFFNEALKFPGRRRGKTINSAISEYYVSEPIMNLLTWSETRMGSSFWSGEHLYYSNFVTQHKFFYDFNINQNTIYEHIKNIQKIVV